MENQDSLIEAYLLGELKGEALKAFEEKQLADQDFAKEVAAERLLVEGVQGYGNQELRARIGDIRSQMLNEEKTKYRRLQPNRLRVIVAVASFLLLLGLSYWLFFKAPSSEQLFANHFYPPYALSLESREQALDAIATDIQAHYQAERFEQAIPLLEKYIDNSQGNAIAQLMLGVSYLGANRLEEAESTLKKVDDPNLKGTKLWYQTLVQVRQENYEEALELLDNIQNQKLNFFYQKANSLKKELEKRIQENGK